MNYTKNKFIGNTAWIMASKIYSMLVSLIVGSLSARYLGPSNYGVLNYGTSIISFFLTISTLGFASTLVVEMVQRPKKEGDIIGTAVAFRLVAAIISYLLIFVIVSVLEPDNKEIQIVTMLQAIVVILNTYEVFLYWFQMRLEMKMVTIASMIALTVTAIWRISLLINKATIEFFALSNTVTALVTGGCILIFFFTPKYRPKLGLDIQLGRQILANSYHFVISGLAITLYTQLDRIMLGKMVSSEAVGYYSAATTVAILWEFIPHAIINSARPILVDIKKRSEEEYFTKYKILLAGITGMGAFIGIAFMVFGRLAIFILYGRSYEKAALPLLILAWSTCFSMIGTTRSIWIVAENKNKYEKNMVLVGAVVNAVLNVVIIPVWGIVGASLTTLISEFVVAIIAPYFFKETRDFCSIYWSSFKSFPAVLAMGKQTISDGLKKLEKRKK